MTRPPRVRLSCTVCPSVMHGVSVTGGRDGAGRGIVTDAFGPAEAAQ